MNTATDLETALFFRQLAEIRPPPIIVLINLLLRDMARAGALNPLETDRELALILRDALSVFYVHHLTKAQEFLQAQYQKWANLTEPPFFLVFMAKPIPPAEALDLASEDLELVRQAFEVELDHDLADVINDVYFPAHIDPKREAEIAAADGSSRAELLESAKAELPGALMALVRTPSFCALCNKLGLETVDPILDTEPPAAEPPVDDSLDPSTFESPL